jgi:hypothetical protein
MSYAFAAFEKLKEIFDAARKMSWWFIPIVGPFIFATWWLVDWLPARAVQTLSWLGEKIPQTHLTLSNVGVDWARINQWVPLNETLTFITIFLSVAGAMIFLRLLKKLIPFA